MRRQGREVHLCALSARSLHPHQVGRSRPRWSCHLLWPRCQPLLCLADPLWPQSLQKIQMSSSHTLQQGLGEKHCSNGSQSHGNHTCLCTVAARQDLTGTILRRSVYFHNRCAHDVLLTGCGNRWGKTTASLSAEVFLLSLPRSLAAF